ncbi:MAG TPA: hypothetical protein VFR41_12685 [Acidimicrobiia bacterium]|nr:hypothetical protein [Acidimicrobiia bacterium]
MRSRLVLFLVPVALVFAACGGSSKGSSPSTQPSGSTVHVAKVATADPSASAKMVCAPEGIKAVNGAIGIDAVKVSTPTWIDHVYSCSLTFKGGGVITLAVKELSNPDETTAYFNSLGNKLGKGTPQAIGTQGSFSTKNGDVVVRKDYKVLLVDVSKAPANLGYDTRGNDAINAAFALMECWTGA